VYRRKNKKKSGGLILISEARSGDPGKTAGDLETLNGKGLSKKQYKNEILNRDLVVV